MTQIDIRVCEGQYVGRIDIFVFLVNLIQKSPQDFDHGGSFFVAEVKLSAPQRMEVRIM
jgi:hypothetical protein